jgi:hypothetical protein
VRGPGPTDHVILYRNQPVCKDLIRARVKAAGERTGVKVHPHSLRHTAATQLLNAGCRVTSIQKLLGHKELNTTMIYARVHDRTVAKDYYSAMEEVERRLDVAGNTCIAGARIGGAERGWLLTIADQLAQPMLSDEVRLNIVAQIRHVLVGQESHALATPALLEAEAR